MGFYPPVHGVHVHPQVLVGAERLVARIAFVVSAPVMHTPRVRLQILRLAEAGVAFLAVEALAVACVHSGHVASNVRVGEAFLAAHVATVDFLPAQMLPPDVNQDIHVGGRLEGARGAAAELLSRANVIHLDVVLKVTFGDLSLAADVALKVLDVEVRLSHVGAQTVGQKGLSTEATVDPHPVSQGLYGMCS